VIPLKQCCGPLRLCCDSTQTVYVAVHSGYVVVPLKPVYFLVHKQQSSSYKHNTRNTIRSFMFLSFIRPSSGMAYKYVNGKVHYVTEAASSTSQFFFMCLYFLSYDGRMNDRNMSYKIVMKVSVVFGFVFVVIGLLLNDQQNGIITHSLHGAQTFLRS
jgi:hypothetical protein